MNMTKMKGCRAVLVALSMWLLAPWGQSQLKAERARTYDIYKVEDALEGAELAPLASTSPQTTKKKTATKKSSGKKSSTTKKRTTTSSRKRAAWRSYRQTVSSKPKSSMREENVLLGRIDSMMLGDGGDFVKMGEPLMVRFRAGDTLLTLRDFELIYYGASKTEARRDEALRLESAVDSLTGVARFGDALLILQKHLLSHPTHLPLLQRACDLAYHERHEDARLYIWQMAELLNLIARSGDGKTAKTAYRVMRPADAMVFESLWLDREPQDIVSQQTSLYEGKELLTLSLRNGEAEPKKVYYILPHKAEQAPK